MKKFHLIFAAMAVALFCAAAIAFPPNSSQGFSQRVATPKKVSPDHRLASAQTANPDTVAWITIPGTNIDGPVQQADDNEYYLRRNSLGENEHEGCFYADFECDLSTAEALSTNTIIYGHSFTAAGQDSDIGFGQLRFYLEDDFAKKHPDIFLSVSDQKLHFSIVSVGLADTAEDQVCILADPTSSQLQALTEKAMARNQLSSSFSIESSDKLLTLSTCTDNSNQRLLLVATLVSD